MKQSEPHGGSSVQSSQGHMVGLVKQSGPHGGSSEAVRASWWV